MIRTLLIVNSFIFFLLGSLHIYWSVGGKWAVEASIPTDSNGRKLLNPGRLSTLAVAFGLFLFMLTDLTYSRLITFDSGGDLGRYLIFAIGMIFLMRTVGDFNSIGFTKQRIQSVFAKKDTRFYSPLSLFIALTHCLAYWSTV